jgi:WD40 repeat protein
VLSVVPTGVGVARQLTHDNVSYTWVSYLPDGKRLLASGIEPGHGARDYLIDGSSGEAKPITPEGTSGAGPSPDGKYDVVQGPDGKWGIWPIDGGGGVRLIPGLDAKYNIAAWSPDGASVYVLEIQKVAPVLKVYRVNVATGKMDFWRAIGETVSPGDYAFNPFFSADGTTYVYGYGQVLSQAYVVKGLK